MAIAATSAALAGGVDHSLNQVVVGKGVGGKGSKLKMFTVTVGTGNYGTGGLTLDLSTLFPSKVLFVGLGMLTKSDYTDAYMATYLPAAANAPATGKVLCYRQTAASSALIELTNDNIALTGYVLTGFAIGY